ncbi:hypothetical protein V1517DRAFT_324357 [Lipomyces orientalis]|uniref:Uncharacterized protein n=1 Tax=Lipomyces orientalis TaxID=1233043 RepID=A0ACC3TLM7_9ASCO
MTSMTSARRLSSSTPHRDGMIYLTSSSAPDNSFATTTTTPPTPPPEASAAGIVTSASGERVIAPTTRKDGSLRKEIRIRPGFVPTEDVARYNVAERVQMRQQRLVREKALREQEPVTAGATDAEIDEASKVLEDLVLDQRKPGPPAAQSGSGIWDQARWPAATSGTTRPAASPVQWPGATVGPRIAPSRQPKNAPSDRSSGWSRSNSADSTTSQDSKGKSAIDSVTATTPRAASWVKTVDQGPGTFAPAPVKNEWGPNAAPTPATTSSASTTRDTLTSTSTATRSGWDMRSSSGFGGRGSFAAESAWTSLESVVSTTGAESDRSLPESAVSTTGAESNWAPLESAVSTRGAESHWTPLESMSSKTTDSPGTDSTTTEPSTAGSVTWGPGTPGGTGLQDRGRSGWKDSQAARGGGGRNGRGGWFSGDTAPDSRRRRGREGGDHSSPGPSLTRTGSNDTPDIGGPRRVDPNRRGQSPEERKRAFEEFLNRPLEMKHNYPSFNQFVNARGGARSGRGGTWASSENDKGATDCGASERSPSPVKVLESRYAH